MLSDSSAPIAVDQLASEQPPETQSVPKAAWRQPTLICIDIKRTLGNTGSFIDGTSGSSPM